MAITLFRLLLVLSCLTLLLSSPALAQVLVPNTFQAGTPARASEVNENFSVLASGIDDTASQAAANSDAILQLSGNPTLSIYAGAQNIGTYLSVRNGTYGVEYLVLSSTGYVFEVVAQPSLSPDDEEIAPTGIVPPVSLWFEDSLCATEPIVVVDRDATIHRAPPAPYSQGLVVASLNDTTFEQTLYYVPRGSTIRPVYLSSVIRAGDAPCETDVFYETVGIQVLPNDTAVTGVPNFPFASPVLLQR